MHSLTTPLYTQFPDIEQALDQAGAHQGILIRKPGLGLALI